MDNYSYRMGASGTILNPAAVTVPFVDITEVKGLDSAELRSTERDHEGVDGGFIDAEFEKMRTIVLEGQLIAAVDSVEPYLDTLKGEWGPGSIKPFYFQHPGVSERVIFVKPIGVKYDITALRNQGCCDVQFMAQAEDPRVYTSALATANISLGVAITTGFGFPLGFPFGFGAAVSPNSVTVNVGGNRPTPPTFTLTGPVTNPVIYNDDTGDELAFEITLATGETLVIDTYYRSVKLNGTQSRRSALLTPSWFYLQPGMNTLRYRATSVGGPDAVVTYRDAWR